MIGCMIAYGSMNVYEANKTASEDTSINWSLLTMSLVAQTFAVLGLILFVNAFPIDRSSFRKQKLQTIGQILLILSIGAFIVLSSLCIYNAVAFPNLDEKLTNVGLGLGITFIVIGIICILYLGWKIGKAWKQRQKKKLKEIKDILEDNSNKVMTKYEQDREKQRELEKKKFDDQYNDPENDMPKFGPATTP